MPTTQVRLRPVTEADLPDYVRWLNDPEVTQFLSMEPGQVTLEGEREWLARQQAPDSPHHVWAVTVDGRHVGNCALDLDERQPTATMGLHIGEKSYWGRGFGTTVVSRVLEVAFRDHHLERVQLSAWAFNRRAIHCYEKCGFRREGASLRAVLKGGRWIDKVDMGLLRADWEAYLAPPQDGLVTLYPRDRDECIALWQQPEVGLWPYAAEDRDTLWEALAHAGPLALGWRAGGRLVGTAIGGWDGLRGWLYRIGVDPAHRRQGIARALVSEVEARLQEQGARQVNLLLWHENQRARQTYQALGYQVGDGVLMMRKRFEPEGGCGC